MVLARTGASMPRSVRDRGARNIHRSLHLSRTVRLWSPRCVGRTLRPCYHLQLDGVALHLIVESGPLDAEKFGRFFLIAPAFCQRLEDSLALHVIESLHALPR